MQLKSKEGNALLQEIIAKDEASVFHDELVYMSFFESPNTEEEKVLSG